MLVTMLQQMYTLLQYSTIVSRETGDAGVRFWSTYKKEAEEYDTDFLERYNGDMDTSMIFVSIYASALSFFCI